MEQVKKAEIKEKLHSNSLTVPQASCLIAGCGVGMGVLAAPYIFDKVGAILGIVILIFSFFAVFLLHWMIADLTIKYQKKAQLIDILTVFIRNEKFKKIFRIFFLIILVFSLNANLTAYVCGASDTLNKLFGFPDWAGKLTFYVVAASIAFFGLKILGIVENYSLTIMVIGVGSLFVASLFNIKNPIEFLPNSTRGPLILLSIFMLSMNAYSAIPHVVQGLNFDKKKITKSLLFGQLINVTILLLIIFGCLISCMKKELTLVDPCIVAWADGIGFWAKIVGTCFTLLALLTSYWSVSFTIRDVYVDHLHINVKLAWLLATLPSIGLSFIPSLDFSFIVSVASLMMSILLTLYVIPAFYLQRIRYNKESILGIFGTLPYEIYTFLLFLAMIVGSILNMI